MIFLLSCYNPYHSAYGFPLTRHFRGSVAPYTGTSPYLRRLFFSVSKIPKTLVRSGFPTAVIRGERRLRPRLFHLLDFDPSKMPESRLVSHHISPFQHCSQIAPNGRFSYLAGVSSLLGFPRHTGGLWATHGRFLGVVYSLFLL